MCLGAKVTFKKKKKAPARKPANSRPEWGSTPDLAFSKLGNWQIQHFIDQILSKIDD